MNFELNDEQQLLKDSAERFVRENYSLEQRRQLAASELGYSESNWALMAELGWLCVGIPEAYGGIDGGAVETMVLMQAFGEGLVLEPYFATSVLGANLVRLAGSQTQCAEILGAVAEGKRKLAFGFAEEQSGFDLHDVQTSALIGADEVVLNGHKSVVLGAPSADQIIVSARVSGDSRDRAGIGLFLIDRDCPGLTIQGYANNDGQRAGEVFLRDARIPLENLLGDSTDSLAVIEQVCHYAIAALAADAVGCMKILVDTTNEYLKTREQFGRPIGQFQVLQHRMSSMWIAKEESESMMLLANASLSAPDASADLGKRFAATKWMVGSRGRYVGEQAVQSFGGMGMTDEMHVGHYFKRLLTNDLMFGDHRYHLRQYHRI